MGLLSERELAPSSSAPNAGLCVLVLEQRPSLTTGSAGLETETLGRPQPCSPVKELPLPAPPNQPRLSHNPAKGNQDGGDLAGEVKPIDRHR